MQHIPELGHPHSIQVKGQGIEEPGELPRPALTEIRNRRHDGKVCVDQLVQLLQIVRNDIPFRLTVPLNLQGNPIDGTTLTR